MPLRGVKDGDHMRDASWDIFFRATGVAAAIGILLLLFVPGSVTLVSLAMLSLPANSPLSPVLPTLFEPVIMGATRYDGVIPVTLVATASYMYMEYVNWHVYNWVFNRERLAWVRDHRSVRWGVKHFARHPFWTVVIFAFTPLPFWVARSLAIVHRYSFPRYMLATLVGKAPSILAYAWAGRLLHIPTSWLVGVIVVTSTAAIASRARRGPKVLSEV
jgi:uncharacterized membrane protein YdjX (TVP38/TMEM64 family)